jgi:MFS family permease
VFWRVFPSLMLPMFLGVVDQTIVATALPAISADLGEVERISWVVVAYLITVTVSAPVYGRLGDVFGRKRMMYVAIGVMAATSLLCAAATSLSMLALARVLQGLGGGGLMTLAQSLIGEAVPPRERGRYQGYLAAVFVVSNAFGPVAGGILTQTFGWRSVFLINLPVALFAALLLWRLPGRGARGEDFRFDFPGLVWFVLFVVPVLLALERIQQAGSPFNVWVVGLVALSGASLFLLLRREDRASYPLLPVTLWRRAEIWRPDALAACHGAALVSLITFLPIYLRVVRGASATETGLLLLPVAIGLGVGSLLTGQMVSRTGYTAIFPSLALLPATALLAVLAFGAGSLSLGGLAVVLGISALLMGSVMGVVQVVVQNAAGSRMLGAAAGGVAFSRSVGAAFGTALVSMLLFSSVAAINADAAAHFAELLARGPAALDGLDPAARQAALAALAQSFGRMFLLIAAYSGAGALLAWSIPSRRV